MTGNPPPDDEFDWIQGLSVDEVFARLEAEGWKPAVTVPPPFWTRWGDDWLGVELFVSPDCLAGVPKFSGRPMRYLGRLEAS